jgi:NAD(P)-dependent dehydrogenase (short-subunit alcohol dehydrogenase family)
MVDLHGKVALVTGSSSGIGEAIARGVAARGAKVVVNSTSSVTAGERVAAPGRDIQHRDAEQLELGFEAVARMRVGRSGPSGRPRSIPASLVPSATQRVCSTTAGAI